MPLLTIQLDDDTHGELARRAAVANQSVETFAGQLLREWLALPVRPARDTVTTRAARANLKGFDDVMAKVPDVPPMPGDELP